MPDPFGIFNINKPSGMTSHDVINRVRRGLKIKKAGHAGTLDPMATGVLVVCVGAATRLSEYAMASQKRYSAQVTLGQTTDTYDAEGEVIAEQDASHVTRDQIMALLPVFTGDIEQLPPMYSAIKRDGKKLYELAREGKTITRDPRAVTINKLSLIDWQAPNFSLDVVCSPGTYIRSLAYDIGERLGVGAHLSALVRTSSGAFTVDSAVDLDKLLDAEDYRSYLQSPDVAVMDLPEVHLTIADTEHIQHGRTPLDAPPATTDYARAYTPAGDLLAILRAKDGRWRPHKVFLTVTS